MTLGEPTPSRGKLPDGTPFIRHRDGSVTIPLNDSHLVDRNERITARKKVATPLPSNGPLYKLAEGIEISPGVKDDLDAIAERFRRSTGSTFIVNSTARGPARQAAAMYVKFAKGGDGHEYSNRRALQEVRDAYRQGKSRGLGEQEIISSMTEVLNGQVRDGIFISRHMLDGAVDISLKKLSPRETQEVLRLAREAGARADIERHPPHIHIQFGKNKPRR